MKSRSNYLLIPALALLHLVVSGALLLMAAGASIGRLETGAPTGPAWPGQIPEVLGTALLYPIFIPAHALLGTTSGPISWMLLLGNSITWAVAAYLMIRLLARRRADRGNTYPMKTTGQNRA